MMNNNIELLLDLQGIDVELAKQYDVLCLPENFGDANPVDSSETLDFYKTLRGEGIPVGNSFDLKLETKTITRRGDDMWLGQIYIINDFVIPSVMAILQHYVTKHFERSSYQVTLTDEAKVHFEVKYNKKGKISKIKYDGNSEDAVKIIEALRK